ncbi:MAG TPA: hydroxyethylthiazole kinase [Longimicrobiaceae bacterium]|nr:hydroxyethylthiazole kinase [Longimicrobiaceae bacterium]
MEYTKVAEKALAEVRASVPLVHNITNYVAMDVTANALLAIGASPAMIHAGEEVEDFVTIASALVVNIGTLSREWVVSMTAAADRAGQLGKPWVLDPVGAGATPYRTSVARDLSRRGPTVIRGNASEILALAGATDAAPKGVDSTQASEAAREIAGNLARTLDCTVAVTGAVDYVTDGNRVLAVANGDPMMTRVTALGCAATALTGAFLAVENDAVLAAASALGVFGLAGELAARNSEGPGTLRWRILDELYRMDAAALSGVRIS